MDPTSRADLGARLAQTANGGPFVLDMTDVSFLDLASVWAILDELNEAGARRLDVTPSSSVVRIFEVRGPGTTRDLLPSML
jgi:hypothetical protein